jgi:hypothetical protein
MMASIAAGSDKNAALTCLPEPAQTIGDPLSWYGMMPLWFNSMRRPQSGQSMCIVVSS